MSKRKPHYQPLEVVVDAAEFARAENVKSNPPASTRLRKLAVSMVRKLEIKIALVRPPGFKRGPQITEAGDVGQFVAAVHAAFTDDVQESFYVLPLNTRNEVVGVYEAARGTINEVAVAPADVIRVVLAAGTDRFIVVHNHPSGYSEPSQADALLTGRLKTAAKCVGLTMLDHVVIGGDGELFSFATAEVM